MLMSSCIGHFTLNIAATPLVHAIDDALNLAIECVGIAWHHRERDHELLLGRLAGAGENRHIPCGRRRDQQTASLYARRFGAVQIEQDQ